MPPMPCHTQIDDPAASHVDHDPLRECRATRHRRVSPFTYLTIRKPCGSISSPGTDGRQKPPTSGRHGKAGKQLTSGKAGASLSGQLSEAESQAEDHDRMRVKDHDNSEAPKG